MALMHHDGGTTQKVLVHYQIQMGHLSVGGRQDPKSPPFSNHGADASRRRHNQESSSSPPELKWNHLSAAGRKSPPSLGITLPHHDGGTSRKFWFTTQT
jgi:hypothetical protein